jgi:DNA-binding IclR family transcriptional regulator
MRIMQFFIEGRHFDYTLSDLARNAGVSWGTLHTVFPKLVKHGLVGQVRTVGRAKLYKINTENAVAAQLIQLYDLISDLNLAKRAQKQLVRV